MSMQEESVILPNAPALAGPFLSRRDGAAELYLIRHADAIPSAEEAIAGGTYDDQPLSRRGQLQSQALAERLKKIEFAALYATPLRRTQETAAPLAEALGMGLIIEDDLREVHFERPLGETPGLADSAATAEAIRTRNDAVVRTAALTGKWESIPGAEPSVAFRSRVSKIVETIAARHPGQKVAIFAHGGVINVYMAVVLGLEKDYFYPIHNTSISVARVRPTANGVDRLLICLNDAAHIMGNSELYIER